MVLLDALLLAQSFLGPFLGFLCPLDVDFFRALRGIDQDRHAVIHNLGKSL